MENLYGDFIDKELLNDEVILWMGRPNSFKFFNLSDIILIPFTIIWFTIAVLWELLSIIALSSNSEKNFVFPIIGIFFVLIGFYLVFGRFIYKKVKLKRTYYTVTNKRIFVITNLMPKKIKSVDLKSLTNITKTINHNGNGNIYFGNPTFFQNFFNNSGLDFLGSHYGNEIIVFVNIGDANNVYQLIYNFIAKQNNVEQTMNI